MAAFRLLVSLPASIGGMSGGLVRRNARTRKHGGGRLANLVPDWGLFPSRCQFVRRRLSGAIGGRNFKSDGARSLPDTNHVSQGAWLKKCNRGMMQQRGPGHKRVLARRDPLFGSGIQLANLRWIDATAAKVKQGPMVGSTIGTENSRLFG